MWCARVELQTDSCVKDAFAAMRVDWCNVVAWGMATTATLDAKSGDWASPQFAKSPDTKLLLWLVYDSNMPSASSTSAPTRIAVLAGKGEPCRKKL